MNLNQQQLETLIQFSEVLHFLQHPEKLDAKLDEAKATLAEIKNLLGAKKTMEEVLKFKVEEEERLRKFNEGLVTEAHELEAQRRDNALKAEKLALEYSQFESQVSVKTVSLQDFEQELVKQRENLQKQEESVRFAQLALDEGFKKLYEAEQDLFKKQEMVKQILGQ